MSGSSWTQDQLTTQTLVGNRILTNQVTFGNTITVDADYFLSVNQSLEYIQGGPSSVGTTGAYGAF